MAFTESAIAYPPVSYTTGRHDLNQLINTITEIRHLVLPTTTQMRPYADLFVALLLARVQEVD